MKRVLVITYYWPPSGGGGVQRVAKFCKYLPHFGWEPVVLTVKKGNYISIDRSFEKDVQHIQNVYKARSIEPHSILQGVTVGGSNANLLSPKGTALRHFLELVRLNLFVPDSRIGWYPYAVQMGNRVCKGNKLDLIFSTCPPYTAHLVAGNLKNKFRRPWVADFRDPWLEYAGYKTAFRNLLTCRINKKLENRVLKTADTVVTVGKGLQKLLESKEPRLRAQTITNGYDESEFVTDKSRPSNRFHVSYFGTLRDQQIPIVLFKALAAIVRTHDGFGGDLHIRFVGNISSKTLRMADRFFARRHWSCKGYAGHDEVITTLQQEQVLVLLVNRIPYNRLIITGKIFEYLRTGNPVLGIGPEDGEAADILRETRSGKMFDYVKIQGITDFIWTHYTRWKQGRLKRPAMIFPKYERSHHTALLAQLFDELTRKAF